MTKSYFKQEHDLGICCVFCFLLLVKNNCVESWIIYKINGWFCLQRREEPRLLGLGRNTQTVSRWELTLIFPLQLSVTDAVYVVLLSVLLSIRWSNISYCMCQYETYFSHLRTMNTIELESVISFCLYKSDYSNFLLFSVWPRSIWWRSKWF